MTINEYLSNCDDTADALAVRCKISTGSMSRIRNGLQNITLALANTIVTETGGAVKIAEIAVPDAA